MLSSLAPGSIIDTSDAPMRTCFKCGRDLHRTFDGMFYNFAGRCIYTLAKMADLFEVQVEMTDCDDYFTCKKVGTLKILKNIDSLNTNIFVYWVS